MVIFASDLYLPFQFKKMSEDKIGVEKYRDKIATVDEHGKRVWLYPKKPKGWWYEKRKVLSYVLLAFLFGMPFIKVGGRQFLQFNIIERSFTLFGLHFAPQDFYLFVLAMLIFILFIVLFTVVFGRLFCGWICPQTIFMEMVYRRIEYWIEGDANAQKRLNKAEWGTDKILKKTFKHILFFGIAVLVANTFLAYIIGSDEVIKIITEPINEHWQGFLSMVLFSFMFYFVFAKLREQVCTTICPYGRLQGVMMDENSVGVYYDYKRGEPRGKISKKKKTAADIIDVENDLPKGDCIDCKLCVQVCPTGIDIRDGLQMECVHCTACMDACDEVMVKINRPTQLIRYDSESGISSGQKKIFTSRVMAYSVVLVTLIGLQIFLMASRTDVDTLFLRTPGMLFQKTDDGYISNLYNYQIINKKTENFPVEFRLKDTRGRVRIVGKTPQAKSDEVTEGAVFFDFPPEALSSRKNEITVEVYSNNEKIDEATTNFLGPIK